MVYHRECYYESPALDAADSIPESVLSCVEFVLPSHYDSDDSETSKQTWTCESCGNENYKYRMVCNMRNCRRLKPQRMLDCAIPYDAWVCQTCGNVNFSTRKLCNMRKCRQPRYCLPSTNTLFLEGN